MKQRLVGIEVMGKEIGISGIAMGKLLKEHGLRNEDDGRPSSKALESGIAFRKYSDRPPRVSYWWNPELVLQELKAQGWKTPKEQREELDEFFIHFE
jgi:hypothetical protein